MLVLPMRSQEPSPSRQSRDCYTTTLPARHRESSPQTTELRRQIAGAMMSIMPSTRPSAPKRPKLSLQTALAPSLNLPPSATESPTVRNTQVNAFDPPPPTPSSAIQPQIHFPTFPPTTLAPSSATHSPYPQDAPYVLPLGTHSILRNSPLPKRHLSATSARSARRMFPPVKRVSFAEKLAEIAPTPVIEDPSDTELDAPATEAEQRRRREVIEAEDGHATPMQGRRKRRREWVWRPMEDDVLASYNMDPVKDPRLASDDVLASHNMDPEKDDEPASDDAMPSVAEDGENSQPPPSVEEEINAAAISSSDASSLSKLELDPSSGATSLSEGSSGIPES